MFHSAGHADLVLVTGGCSRIIQLGHWHYISSTYDRYILPQNQKIHSSRVRAMLIQVVTFSFFLLTRFYHSAFLVWVCLTWCWLAPCMVPTCAHLACQASAPWKSPQKRNSKSQELEEDAGVFCSWIGVGYMHTSQNTTALAFATPSSQNVIWGKWIEWSPWPNLDAIHTSVIRAPCLTRTKRPPCHALNCHMRSIYTLSLAQVAANCLWHFYHCYYG